MWVVYCLLDVGVSQETLHDPDIHLCVNPSGGECVTQTVRGESADTRLVANPVEDTAHIDGVLGATQLGTKDKVVVLIGGSGFCFVLLLLFENVCQQFYCRIVERDSLLAGILGAPKARRQLSSGLSGSFT